MKRLILKIGFLVANLMHVSAFVAPMFGTSTRISSISNNARMDLTLSRDSQINAPSNTTMDALSEDGRRQLRAPAAVPKMPTHEGANSVTPVHSISEFLNLVENTDRNELVVVKFHAKWCKVCARVIIKFKKMADQLLKTNTSVPIRFVSVQVTDNPQLCSTLGVKKFPFIQIYRNRECVAAFGTGPAHNFQKVVGDTLDQKLKCTDDEWNAFRADFKDVIAENLEKLEMLRLESAIETGITNSNSNVSP